LNFQWLSRFRPWIYFGIFLASNFLLSYFAFPLEARLWIGLLGLLLPFGFLLRQKPQAESLTALNKEFLPPLPLWAWTLLGAAAVFIRFYKLTSLSVWPLYDEGMYGYYASGLTRQWNWQMFYGSSQAPPLYIWMEAGLFKLFGVSLSTLWLLPALVSSLLFPAAYWAARGFFSRSLSVLAAVLFGLSFWPAYVGRFSLMTGLVLLAECLALGALARLLTETRPASRPVRALLLGGLVGLGFYTYLHWPALAALLVLGIFVLFWWEWRKNPSVAFKVLFGFSLSAFLVLLPLLMGFSREVAGQLSSYLNHLSAAKAASGWNQFQVSASYVASLFWGMDLSYHTYQPVWGGYLNPVLGAFFFLGLAEALRRLKEPFFLWLLAALALFVLPGALTSERATSRMILVFPVLALMVVLGFRRLLAAQPKRVPLWIALGVLSLGLDAFHLAYAYPRVWENLDHWKGYEKSYARYQAYLHLKAAAEKDGPGLIFADFVPGLADQTLTVASYGFNAAQNPKLDPGQAHWAAVLANVNYQPFLKRRFSDGTAYALSKDSVEPDGGWMLWVFPVTPARLSVLRQWQAASHILEPFVEESLCDISGRSHGEMDQALDRAYPAFRGDPFLESCFWEKQADLFLRHAMLSKDFPSSSSAEIAQSAQCLSQAVQKGYPAAHLYRQLGVDELLLLNDKQARLDLGKALRAPLNFTDAAQFLKIAGPPISPKGGPP
jgi:4-amino-4-deoxy-L-arabinose transferase-like glycosyltransferase